jgi:hypothetical protein
MKKISEKEFAINGFYEILIRKTDQAKRELKKIQEALEKDSDFVLVDNNPYAVGRRGVMTYTYGMLVLIRNADTVVFRADTKAICGFYKQDDKYIMLPFLGADKARLGIEIDRILRNANIDVEVHDETDSFDGPWQWTMPKKQKLLIGVPVEIVNLSGKQRYATNVAKEFVPIIENELKREHGLEQLLRNCNIDKMYRA